MRKVFKWDLEKNVTLLRERGISFEAIIAHIEAGNVVAIVPGKGHFAHQRQFLVAINRYLYVVPFVEDDEQIFLKTIIPSRKLTKRYLEGQTRGEPI